jgi:hypothetical protein
MEEPSHFHHIMQLPPSVFNKIQYFSHTIVHPRDMEMIFLFQQQ